MITNKISSKVLVLLLVTILSDLLISFYIYIQEERIFNDIKNEYKKELDELFSGAKETFRLNAKNTFEGLVNREDVLSIIRKLPEANDEEVKKLHNRLYTVLKERYKKLQSFIGIRQLHFHQVDGRSFLRMHRPDKYNDHLFNIRHSVYLANTQKKYVEGFEEGRIFNGMRYVFPIIENGKHYGSVEVSYSMSALIRWFKSIYPNDFFYFIIDKDTVEAKVFNDEKNNYKVSSISDKYLEDKEVSNIYKGDDKKYLLEFSDYKDKLDEKELFIKCIDKNNKKIVATFLPIKNIKNKVIAYFIRVDKKPAHSIHEHLIERLIGLYFLSAVIFFIFYKLIKKDELTNYENIKLTNTLKERDELLEQLKETNELMLSQSRQAAIGDTIGLLAHQWRQPIAIIEMQINNIILDMELDQTDKDTMIKELNIISKNIEQLSETISDFQAQFKKDEEIYNVKVSDILDDALNIIKSSLKYHNINISIDNNVKDSIKIRKDLLFQVLLALLSNAKEMLITRDIENPKIDISISKQDSNLEISICDNAGGIEIDKREKIFEPYFTTKNDFNNKGVGLYISKLIIEKKFNGTLSVSNTDIGACFKITLNMDRDKYNG